MGLDMYLRGEKFFWNDWENPSRNRSEDGFKVHTVELELGYWRKHPNLHGYIVENFAEADEDGDKDRCQRIDLDASALCQIIAAVKNRELPHTTGFFFGQSDLSDPEIAEDVRILEAALHWLDDGDQEPVTTDEPVSLGSTGFSAMAVKLRPETTSGQKVSRTVYYRASW